MNIVYMNPSGQLGGAEIALLDLMSGIRDAEPGWHLHLLIGGDGPLAERARSLGCATTILNLPSTVSRLGDAGVGGPAGKQIWRLRLAVRLLVSALPVARYLKRLRATLAALRPDLIHTNGFKMHVLGAWARPNGVPLIWHIHDYVSSRPVMARLLHRYADRCTAAIANSQSVAADLASVLGASFKVQAVYNGIDLERFTPQGPALDLDRLSGMSPAEDGTVRVGLIGTFSRWKGHAVFLKSISLLPKELKIRSYIVGDAIYATEGSQHSLADLRATAEALGVADRVGFTGFVEDVPAAMRALDIVVHASTEPEPFGLVIAEAMACGRAVIVSSAGGAGEITSVGENAFGHKPGDSSGLAEGIERLATGADLRTKLGMAGRATAESRFDRNYLSREVISAYRMFAGSLQTGS